MRVLTNIFGIKGIRKSRHVTELLSAYLDGQLSERQTACVESHLLTCSQCRGELEQMRKLLALLRLCPPAQPRRSFTIDAELAPALLPRRPVWAPVVAMVAVLVFCTSLYAESWIGAVGVPGRMVTPALAMDALRQTGTSAAGLTTPSPIPNLLAPATAEVLEREPAELQIAMVPAPSERTVVGVPRPAPQAEAGELGAAGIGVAESQIRLMSTPEEAQQEKPKSTAFAPMQGKSRSTSWRLAIYATRVLSALVVAISLAYWAWRGR